MRKLAFALLAGVTFGTVTVASASDLPARMPRKAPPAHVYAPVPFTWSGFYVGANAGWGWTQRRRHRHRHRRTHAGVR